VIQAETEELRASRTALCSITAGTCLKLFLFNVRLYAVWAHIEMICLCCTLHTDVLKLSLDLLGIETVEEL
jgi:hypothetical protein